MRHRIGRAIPWKRVFAFEAVQKRPFFATDVCPGAAPNVDLKLKVGSKDVLAKKPRFFRFGRLHVQGSQEFPDIRIEDK